MPGCCDDWTKFWLFDHEVGGDDFWFLLDLFDFWFALHGSRFLICWPDFWFACFLDVLDCDAMLLNTGKKVVGACGTRFLLYFWFALLALLLICLILNLRLICLLDFWFALIYSWFCLLDSWFTRVHFYLCSSSLWCSSFHICSPPAFLAIADISALLLLDSYLFMIC